MFAALLLLLASAPAPPPPALQEPTPTPEVTDDQVAERYPGADPEAVAFLEKSLAEVKAAQALHFRLSGTLHSGEDFARTTTEGRIAKPAYGRIDIEDHEIREDEEGLKSEAIRRISFRGDGRGIRMADDSRGVVIGPPLRSWKQAEGTVGLPHFAAWAGAPAPTMRDLAFAPPDEENYPGHVGLHWIGERDGAFTAWFTPEGAWVALHVLRDAGTDTELRVWIAVESLTPVEEVDAQSYASPVPEDYTTEERALPILVPAEEAESVAAEPSDAEAQRFPHADADALAWWLAWRGKVVAARGLDFDAALELKTPQAEGTMSFRVHVARGALGRIEAESTIVVELPEREPKTLEEQRLYVGDGTLIRRELPESAVPGTWSRWADCEVADGLFALAAWSGAEQPTLHGLHLLDPDPKRPGQTGLSWQTDDRLQQTWWFDAQGRWLGGTIQDGVGTEASTFTLTVKDFALHAEIYPETYRSEARAAESEGTGD